MRRFNWQINQLQVHLARHAIRYANLFGVVYFRASIDALDVRAERGQGIALRRGGRTLILVRCAAIILHAPIALPGGGQAARAAGGGEHVGFGGGCRGVSSKSLTQMEFGKKTDEKKTKGK